MIESHQRISTTILEAMPRRWRYGREVTFQVVDSQTIRVMIYPPRRTIAGSRYYEVAEDGGAYAVVYPADDGGFVRRDGLSREDVARYLFRRKRKRRLLGSRFNPRNEATATP